MARLSRQAAIERTGNWGRQLVGACTTFIIVGAAYGVFARRHRRRAILRIKEKPGVGCSDGGRGVPRRTSRRNHPGMAVFPSNRIGGLRLRRPEIPGRGVKQRNLSML